MDGHLLDGIGTNLIKKIQLDGIYTGYKLYFLLYKSFFIISTTMYENNDTENYTEKSNHSETSHYTVTTLKSHWINPTEIVYVYHIPCYYNFQCYWVCLFVLFFQCDFHCHTSTEKIITLLFLSYYAISYYGHRMTSKIKIIQTIFACSLGVYTDTAMSLWQLASLNLI